MEKKKSQLPLLSHSLLPQFPTTKPTTMPNPLSALTIICEKLAEKLVDGAVTTASWISSEVSRIQNVDSDLKELNRKRTRIEATLSDVVQRRNVEDDGLKCWLREIKSIALDIEDLSDEFHTQANISKDRTRKRKRDAALTSNRRFADRIVEIKKRYESVCSARGELSVTAEEASRKSVAVSGAHLLPSQESCLQDAQVYGRDDEIDKIVGFLLSEDDDGSPVLSINGCGGLGKTTLARRAFNDGRVEERFKKMRIWVGLEKGFGLARTTEEIVKSIEKKECRLSSLNLLQYRLKQLLDKKKFLLVLDNVWNEDLVSDFELSGADANEFRQDDVEMARYALLRQYNQKDVDLGKVFGNKCLRALMLYGEGGMLSKQVLYKLFSEMRYLRVLDLSCSMLDELPDSVGDLILLRYLNLSSTRIAMLPESVGNLYNLQTLELGNCSRLMKLPDSVGDLKHLRYLGLRSTKIERLPESVSNLESLHTLELGKCYQLLELPKGLCNLVSLKHLGLHLDWEVWDMETDPVSMPVGIGKLTSLQTLSRFVIGSQRGCGIEELRNLKLRGELCISKLELISPDEAKRAKLEEKQRIDTMMLRWNGGAGSNSQHGRNDEEVLKHLRPHVNLKQLWIDNYEGNRFPEWVGEPSFKNLECLRLSNCTQCQSLPSVRQLPQLKILRIEGLQGVKSMDHVFSGSDNAMGFPCLESLSLRNMPCLQKFAVIGGDMAQLSELTISNCSNLKQLPYLPPSVSKLEIRDCPELTSFPELPFLQDLVIVGGRNETFGWIERCSSLSSLTISKFRSRECIPKGLTSLSKLLIQECDQLVSLDQNECLQSRSSLEHLEISSCPLFSFSSDEKLPANLKELRLVNCKNITSWPELESLSALHIMEIQNLPGLRSLPLLPMNLNYLTISGCPKLQKWCYNEGAAWLEERDIAFLKIDRVEPTSLVQKIAEVFLPRS